MTEKPTSLSEWPEDCEYLMSVDENGTAQLAGVARKLSSGKSVDINDRYFTITGVVLCRADYPAFRDDILTLKRRFWQDGKYLYKGIDKAVCFHSRDIRKRQGPFASPQLDYDGFIGELSLFLEQVPCVIYSSTVDKVSHCKKYAFPDHPYNLALNLIVERFCLLLRQKRSKGIILLESRGAREDRFLLQHLNKLFAKGNSYYRPEHFECIQGVYFNGKWGQTKNGWGSHITLELADLFSYPVHKYIRQGKADQAFCVVERKLFNYPCHQGYGLKLFP